MDRISRYEADYEIARKKGARPQLLEKMEQQIAKLKLRCEAEVTETDPEPDQPEPEEDHAETEVQGSFEDTDGWDWLEQQVYNDGIPF